MVVGLDGLLVVVGGVGFAVSEVGVLMFAAVCGVRKRLVLFGGNGPVVFRDIGVETSGLKGCEEEDVDLFIPCA